MSSNTVVVNAFPASTTTYTVTGTDANGCIATATSKVIPYAEVKPGISINPTENCAPGSPIVSTVEEAPANSNAGVWNYRFLEEDGNTIVQDWSTSRDFNFIPGADSVYKFFYQVKNVACSPNDLDLIPFKLTVGFGGDVQVVDYNCINLGGEISVNNAFGQVDGAEIFNNDFSATLPSNVILENHAALTDGRIVLTPSATGKSGSARLDNAGIPIGSDNSMTVSFDLTVDQPIAAFGLDGADGISYSFGDDAVVASPGNGVNGKGTKLRLSFDSAPNENGNVPGVYLVYDWTVAGAFAPTSTQTLAYSDNTALWKNKTDVPVVLKIQNGIANLWVDNVQLLMDVPMPAAYVAADASNWKHLFTAATGGSANRHAIDNLSIATGNLFYGISNSATTLPTQWQSSTVFEAVQPGTYHVWLSKDITGACSKNIETIEIINTDPVVDLGTVKTLCPDSTIILDAGNAGATYLWTNAATTQTIEVTTAGTYEVTATMPNGCFATGSVIVNVGNIPTAGGITMTSNGQAYTFTVVNPMNGDTYDWDFGDGSTLMNASTTESHTYTTDGTVTVSVTISNNCGNVVITDNFEVDDFVGIQAIELEGLAIYPNPASSELTISLDAATESFVSVSSITGAIIVNETSFSSTTKINVENWGTGIYLVKVSNKGATTTQRVVVQ